MSTKNLVLVAGAQGVSGSAAVQHWSTVPNTEVYGLSRRNASDEHGTHHISVDLLNAPEVAEKLRAIPGVTHIVFGAYIEKPTAAEKSEVNVAILKNLLDVVEQTSPTLKHISFYQGGKAYGSDLGPFKTPAREDDPG